MMCAAHENIDFASIRKIIIRQFYLGRESIHGPSHWDRVELIGARLCESSGADRTVVRLFSLFHDSRRVSEGSDPQHGARGAKLVEEMRGTHFSRGQGMEHYKEWKDKCPSCEAAKAAAEGVKKP